MFSTEIMQCIEDMRQAAQNGTISLDSQVRAYDLLEKLCSDSVMMVCSTFGPAEEYCTEYDRLASLLEAAYDEQNLKTQARERLLPFETRFKEAETRSNEATTLHECARMTFDIWQNGGFFARQKALRKLRSAAGFRLESHRIGNYVAKTFDLMNEARASYALAQQVMFAADVTYKIKPGVFASLASVLRTPETNS